MKTKRPSDITPGTGDTSRDVTSKPKSLSRNKSPTTHAPEDSVEKVQPRQSSTPDSASKATLPTPKTTTGSQKLQKTKHAPIPDMPTTSTHAMPLAPRPNAEIFRESWPAYREAHAASSDHLRRIEPRCRRLSNIHSRLSQARQSLRVKAVAFNHSLQSMNALPSWLQQEWTAHRSGQELYEQSLNIYHQKVNDLKMLLAKIGLTQHPKSNALRDKLLKKIDELPVIKATNTAFIRAYSTFVQNNGLAPARQHHFDSTVNALISEQETLKSFVTILNQQRAHFRQMALTSVSDTELTHTQLAINGLHLQYQVQLDHHRALQHKIESFIDSIESVSTQQNQAGQKQELLNKRKAHLAEKIEKLPAIEIGSTTFTLDYKDFMLRHGQQQCKNSSLENSCNKLIADHQRNAYTHNKLQLFSQSLQRSVQQALTQEGLDEAEAGLVTLEDSLEKYQEDFKTHTRDVSLFHKDLDSARKQFQSDTLNTRYATLIQLFQNAPPTKNRVQPLTPEERSAVDTITDPSLRLEQQQLLSNLDNQYLQARRNAYFVNSLSQTIRNSASSPPSPDTIEQFEDDVQSYLDLLSSHHLTTTAYEEMKERVLSRIPVSPQIGTAIPSTRGTEPSLSPQAKQFLRYFRKSPDPLQNILTTSALAFADGTHISPTISERVQLIRKILAKNPSLNLNALDPMGHSLIHIILFSSHFAPNEQAHLLEALAELGADFNQQDFDGDTPLDLSLKLSVSISPIVIETLQRNGAKFSTKEDLPIIAHLLGTGGTIPLSTPAGKKILELEGLTEGFAQLGLDPIISKSIIETSHEASPPMQGPLQAARSAWQNTRDYPGFIKTIQQAGSGEVPPPVGPKVLVTGWIKPDGHAVGFVFNQEADGNYLYACNTGDLKDPRRSIVKYNVTDIDKAVKFFQECSEDRNETRRFYSQKPSAWGLKRCPKNQQLPDSLDKASQKRGNCPMASRKACLLATLWSTSRQNDVPPELVKSTYKKITTQCRQEGVHQAIESGSIPLMGRALVSMITKLDRLPCQPLAYQLAVAILERKKSSSTDTQSQQPLQIPEVTSKEYVNTLRSALKASKQNLKARKPYYSGDLKVHALRKGNTQAAAIIQRLSS